MRHYLLAEMLRAAMEERKRLEGDIDRADEHTAMLMERIAKLEEERQERPLRKGSGQKPVTLRPPFPTPERPTSVSPRLKHLLAVDPAAASNVEVSWMQEFIRHALRGGYIE